MRLDDARLCLDCEEIHEEQECPACGSEVFAFLTRWIQSTAPVKLKGKPTTGTATSQDSHSAEQLAAWREITDGPTSTPSKGRKLVGRSLLGLAAMGLAGWAWAKTSAKDPNS